jgi:hypothetical protein
VDRTLSRHRSGAALDGPRELLQQPGSLGFSSNQVIEVEGNTVHAETDSFVVKRDEIRHARLSRVGGHRDLPSQDELGQWVITNRTGVSVARPGEESTDVEWRRALGGCPGRLPPSQDAVAGAGPQVRARRASSGGPVRPSGGQTFPGATISAPSRLFMAVGGGDPNDVVRSAITHILAVPGTSTTPGPTS